MKFSVVTLTYNQLPDLEEKLLPALQRQTFQDFEWVLASDGSTDGTKLWADTRGIKIYHKEQNTGFGLTNALNSSFALCEGNYIVWIMGDSVPKSDFLEKLSYAIDTVDRGGMFCGVRYDTDWKHMEVKEPEWRVRNNPNLPWYQPRPFELHGHHSYGLMTLNGMCMSRADFLDMGGIPKEYSQYGKQDWYMAAWVYYHSKPLWIVPEAKLYHKIHPEHRDSNHNTRVFEDHLSTFMETI